MVASPYRQRRVRATAKMYLPDLQLINAPVPSTFAQELQVFSQKKQDLIQLIKGEVLRIIQYPALGYMAEEEIPEWVKAGINLIPT